MKIFLDTADLEEIQEAVDMGVLDGVTTNPTLIKKAGAADFHTHIHTICEMVEGDVSAEVVSTTYEDMISEARDLAAIHPHVVVKIPLIKAGIKAIRTLSQEGIRINTTLCFSPSQALLAAKAGTTYISPFVGRLDDISTPGMELIEAIIQIYANYNLSTEVLVASIRHPMHVVEAALMGAHVATMPYAVFEKLIHHPLTDIGLERFLKDWEAYQQSLLDEGARR